MVDVTVLVSLGRHPASGRPRRAPADARAVELALSIPSAKIHLLHAGDPHEPALRDYLGMGVGRLTVLACPPTADILPPLIGHLRRHPCDIALAGMRAEAGEDGGFLPYAVAEALGMALTPAVVDLRLQEGRAVMLQALPRGRRRRLAASLPLLCTVPLAAPAPRLAALGPARRAMVEAIEAEAPLDAERQTWKERPARPRPQRLRIMANADAAERARAATVLRAGEGRRLVGASPDVAAEAIWAYLVQEGMVCERRKDYRTP